MIVQRIDNQTEAIEWVNYADALRLVGTAQELALRAGEFAYTKWAKYYIPEDKRHELYDAYVRVWDSPEGCGAEVRIGGVEHCYFHSPIAQEAAEVAHKYVTEQYPTALIHWDTPDSVVTVG